MYTYLVMYIYIYIYIYISHVYVINYVLVQTVVKSWINSHVIYEYLICWMSAMTVENRPIIKLQLYIQFLRIVNSRFWDDR